MRGYTPKKILVFGKSFKGKTRFATAYVRKSDYQCYFVFDHSGQFAHRNKVKAAATPDELEAQFRRRFVLFDPALMFPGNTTGAFQFFCEWSFNQSQLLRGRKLLFLDELQSYANRYKAEWELALVLETGRHAGIEPERCGGLDFIGVTLGPNRINDVVRGQATEWVTFNLTDDTQIDPLLGLGFDSDAIKALPNCHFISRTESGDVRKGKL